MQPATFPAFIRRTQRQGMLNYCNPLLNCYAPRRAPAVQMWGSESTENLLCTLDGKLLLFAIPGVVSSCRLFTPQGTPRSKISLSMKPLDPNDASFIAEFLGRHSCPNDNERDQNCVGASRYMRFLENGRPVCYFPIDLNTFSVHIDAR